MGYITPCCRGKVRDVQGCTKRLFPGWVNMGWKNCALLPAVGKQNATFESNFTQPWKSLLVQPCKSIFLPNCVQQEFVEKSFSSKLILFQNVFYTMFSTAIGFYLPAALVSFIYYKLFMVFREELALKLGVLKCFQSYCNRLLRSVCILYLPCLNYLG